MWVVIFVGLAALVILAWDLGRVQKARRATYNPGLQVGGNLYVPRYHNG